MTPNVIALLCPVSGLPWAIMSSQWHCTLSDLAFNFQFQENYHDRRVFHPWRTFLARPQFDMRDSRRWSLSQKNVIKETGSQTSSVTSAKTPFEKFHNLAWSIEVSFIVHKSLLIRAISGRRNCSFIPLYASVVHLMCSIFLQDHADNPFGIIIALSTTHIHTATFVTS